MDINLIVTMVKARIGLTSEVRDTYLTAIANAVVTELEGELDELKAKEPECLKRT